MIPGTTSSRSASLSTMTQFFPPSSAMTRGRWRAPALGAAAAAARMSRPTGHGAGEGDRLDARVPRERRSDVAGAGQQGERLGGNAAVAQRPHELAARIRGTARRA